MIPGLLTGEVVKESGDPEGRLRVKVRVHGIHDPGTPPDGLPWAEVAFSGASPMIGGSGDFKPYRVGDCVLLGFIAGEMDLPVVISNMTNSRSGVPAIPIGSSTDESAGLGRWTRKDMEGNEVELSENAGELWVRLKSGGASLTLSQRGDSILVRSQSGNVSVEGSTVNVSAGIATVSAANVTLDASGENESEIASGVAMVRSNSVVDIISATKSGVAGILDSVNIGGRADRYKGVPVPPPIGHEPLQSAETNLRARTINIGVGPQTNPDIDMDVTVPLKPTLNINIRATNMVRIASLASVVLESPIHVAINSTGFLTIKSVADTSIECLGSCTVKSAGPATLASVSSVVIQAPTVTFMQTPPSIPLPPVVTV